MKLYYSLLSFLPFLLQSIAQPEIECPNTDLQSYLLQLIDALYANGLTTFESLLVSLTATDKGYDLLSHIYTHGDQMFTLLVPTDSAFQMAGIWAPFQLQSSEYLLDLFGLHTLQGHFGYNELPSEKGKMGIGKSMMRVATEKGIENGTRISGTASDIGWQENIVMKRGEQGSVVLKTALGDIGSWSGPAHLESFNLLDNLVILPIDHVISSPPNISTALTLPTTTRSPKGLNSLLNALHNVSATGADTLTQMTVGGLTFFAPVDDAWGTEAWAQINDPSLKAKLIGNHYSNNWTTFSTDWSKGMDLTIMTGHKLHLSIEGDQSFVSLGDQKAQILRSDIAVENGVLHIIDKVLLVPSNEITEPKTIVNKPLGTGPSNTAGPKPSSSTTTSQATSNLATVSTLYWVFVGAAMVYYIAGV